jgi:hypothetical protein
MDEDAVDGYAAGEGRGDDLTRLEGRNGKDCGLTSVDFVLIAAEDVDGERVWETIIGQQLS